MAKRSFMSGEEKTFVKELVHQKINIIECKKTDAVSVSKKKKAWLEIATEFNSAGENSYHTAEQFRKYWENTKSKRRKDSTAEKNCRMATGGGPYVPPSMDTVDDVFDATLDIEIKDSVDSDAYYGNKTYGIETDHDYLLDSPVTTVVNDMQINESIPGPSTVITQNISVDVQANLDEPDSTNAVRPTASHKNKKSMYLARGTAIEKELAKRLERTNTLKVQEGQLHLLRMEEQKLKVQEQRIRLEIAQEILKQEKLKTQKLL